MSELRIRKAETSDVPAILGIVMPTIREGATLALDPEASEAGAPYDAVRAVGAVGSEGAASPNENGGYSSTSEA